MPVSFTLVQGSVRQDVKWSPEYQRQTLEHYMRLTLDGVRANVGALSGAKEARPQAAELAPFMGRFAPEGDATLAPALPDVLLWPETAMPFAYPSGPLSGELRGFVREMGLPLLFGAPAWSARRRKDAALQPGLSADSAGDGGHYDKEHLVPFGEYLPPVLDWKIFEACCRGSAASSPARRSRSLPCPFRTGRP